MDIVLNVNALYFRNQNAHTMKFVTLITIMLLSVAASGQQFQWIATDTVQNDLNPTTPRYNVAVDPLGNTITTRMSVRKFYYGQQVYGTFAIDKYDPFGNKLWAVYLEDSVELSEVTTDQAGNVFIAGSFMGEMSMSGNVLLTNTSTSLWSQNYFIMKFNPVGNLQWVHNTSIGRGWEFVSAMTIDPNNNFWFVSYDFHDAKLIRTDVMGNPVDSVLISGLRTLSGFQFDTNGDVYVCGAAEIGTLTAGGVSTPITNTYNFYLLKLTHTFQFGWLRVARDETFQLPELIVDNGGVYLAAGLLDSTTWDTLHLHQPVSSFNVFLVKFDVNGNAQWGRQVPLSTGFGRLTGASDKLIAVDQYHNIMLFGLMNGTIDWGNGVIASVPVQETAFHIVNFRPDGVANWQKTYGSPTNFGYYPWSIDCGENNDCYTAQLVTDTVAFDSLVLNCPGDQTFVLAKLDITNTQTSIPSINVSEELIFPNPAEHLINFPKGWLNQEVKITNVHGQIVRNFRLTETAYSFDFPSGVYFVSSESGTQKLVVR